MAEKTLDTLFHDTLKDIHHAERKILKSLPKMQRAAQAAGAEGGVREAQGRDRGPDRAPAAGIEDRRGPDPPCRHSGQ